MCGNVNCESAVTYFFLTLTGTALAGFCFSGMLTPVLTALDIPSVVGFGEVKLFVQYSFKVPKRN